MASLTLKNIGAGNAPAGTTAAVGDELHQVRLEIETLLRERLGHV